MKKSAALLETLGLMQADTKTGLCQGEDMTNSDEQAMQVNDSTMHKLGVMQKLFRKESHYVWATAFLVSAHVLYMTYLFPRDWADTPAALELIDRMASIVPALKFLQQNVPSYTHYWGVFYATFWIMVPIYFVLGFVGSFFLTPYRQEILIVKTSWVRIWAIFFLLFILAIVTFTFPMLSFGIFINQMSEFAPKLILSWFVTAGIIYSVPRIACVLILKFKLNCNH
jgi:hypothetical protein